MTKYKKGLEYKSSRTNVLQYSYLEVLNAKRKAQQFGWINYLGNLNVVAPGKTIGGDIYRNKDGRLPESLGRIWYEADINYDSGYRNCHRPLYSNDGRMFATYDHYMTFVQIH